MDTKRSDGLDSALSPNSGLGLSDADVRRRCEGSPAVSDYGRDPGGWWIEWVGEAGRQVCPDAQAALIAIRRMECS